MNMDLLHEELSKIKGAVSIKERKDIESGEITRERVANYTVTRKDGVVKVKGLPEDLVAEVLKNHNPANESKKQKAKKEKAKKRSGILKKLGLTEEELAELL